MDKGGEYEEENFTCHDLDDCEDVRYTNGSLYDNFFIELAVKGSKIEKITFGPSNKYVE